MVTTQPHRTWWLPLLVTVSAALLSHATKTTSSCLLQVPKSKSEFVSSRTDDTIFVLFGSSRDGKVEALESYDSSFMVVMVVTLLASGLVAWNHFFRVELSIVDDALSDGSSYQWDVLKSILLVLRNVSPAIAFGSFAFGLMAPLETYVRLDFFARRYTHPGTVQIHCETSPDSEFCKMAVHDNVKLGNLMGCLAAASSFFLGPLVGMISDAYGRKPTIIITACLALAPYIAEALFVYFNVSLYVFFGLKIFAFIPSLAVWFAMLADLAPKPEIRATIFGASMVLYEVMVLLGMVVGSMLSLKTALAVGILSHTAQIIYMLACVPESLPQERRKPLDLSSGVFSLVGGLSILFRNSKLRTICSIYVLSEFSGSGVDVVGTSYLQKYLAWTEHDNYLSGILGQMSILTWLGVFLPPILAMSGEVGVFFISQFVMTVYNACFCFVRSPHQVFALTGFLSGAGGLTFPATAALKGSMVADDEQGHVQGAVQTVKDLAGALGPVFFGMCFNVVDASPTLSSSMGHQRAAQLIFVMAATLNLCALPLVCSLPRDLIKTKAAAGGD